MKLFPVKLLPVALATLGMALPAHGATVTSAGYTNDFTAQPSAADWATRTLGTAAGAFTSAAGLTAAVQTNSAALITAGTVSNNGNPPANAASATWSSTGLYLQTRPTGNAATLLMAVFTNGTGADSLSVRIGYDYVTNRAANFAEEVRGQLVFYSLSGAEGSWQPIPALTQTGQGTLSATVALAGALTNNGTLYLLWADDNGSGVPDDANDIDNFALEILPAGASVVLVSPTNNLTHGFHRPLPLVAQPVPGPGATATGVGFYELTGGFLASATAPPYSNGVSLAVGTYQIYAAATNSLGAVVFSATNTVFVVVPPTNTTPPAIFGQAPAAGLTVSNLTAVQVLFTEPVVNVDAGDLLVNEIPASGVSGGGSNYVFTFAQPPNGTVNIRFDAAHGITDLGYPSDLAFDHSLPAAAWSYSLVDAAKPLITARVPAAGAAVGSLTQITVTFSEAVSGVDAGDLLVNGVAATGVSGSGADFVFTFTQPGPGAVSVNWAAGHAIQDVAGNVFDPSTPGHTWSYTLLDQIAPVVTAQNPAAGSFVPALSSITVSFSESVLGVNASDLRVNGVPATGVSGGPTNYTFAVPLLNATAVNVTWAPAHGVTDTAAPANAFNATGPGATWSYTTTDALAPSASVFPTPSLTVARLAHLNVSFDEPVTGVNAADLLINGAAATNVTGSGAGPYQFTFPSPPTGAVSVAWSGAHGIADLAANAFAGGAWSYVLDPTILGDYVVRHVVQVSLDGLAAVHLRFYVTNAPDQFPNFVRLINEGAWTMNARCDYEYSETVPNHATMFMARPVAQPAGAANTVHHGYNNNFPGGGETFHNAGNLNVAYKQSMMDVAHDYGRKTALYTGKTRLDICDRSYNALNGAPDLIGADNGTDKIDFSSIADVSGNAISNEVTQLITNLLSATPSHYSFIHIAEPDITGHSAGWGSANWSNAVRNVDAQIGRILNAMNTNAVLSNQSALIITADHGGGGVTANGHTEAYHPNNFTIPFFVRAPGIRPGSDAYALFANRANPGTNRTDYNTQPQPIRNGDASNLALSFLGLPPIPGSFIVPALNSPANTLRIARGGALTTVFWYDPNNSSVLEEAGVIGSPTAWSPLTSGIILSETTKSYTVTNGVGPTKFFRVRKL